MTKRALILVVLLLLASRRSLLADGGRLRFSKTAGPFLVTLFTTPEPLTPGPADFSVMVQNAKTNDILSDAQIVLTLTSVDHPDQILRAAATHGNATNRLLQAAEFDLPGSSSKSSEWKLHINVEQGREAASLDEPIEVQAGSRKTMLVWIFGALPILALFLFVLHQRQRASIVRRPRVETTSKI